MRSTIVRASTAVAAAALVLLPAGPAVAAQQPNDQATCLAAVFQAQAVDAPRTVSDRILEIRALYLQGSPFGQALKPLALDLCGE